MKKKYVIGIIIIIILLISSATLFFWPPTFKLKGNNITLKYGQDYKEPGYTVTKFGKDYSKKVKIKDKINPKKLGTYEIIYELKLHGITYKQIRKVTITDKEKPKITLNGNQNITICPKCQLY